MNAAEAEQLFRKLLRDRVLPAPDRVEYYDDGVLLCLWNDQKVAFEVDYHAADADGDLYFTGADLGELARRLR